MVNSLFIHTSNAYKSPLITRFSIYLSEYILYKINNIYSNKPSFLFLFTHFKLTIENIDINRTQKDIKYAYKTPLITRFSIYLSEYILYKINNIYSNKPSFLFLFTHFKLTIENIDINRTQNTSYTHTNNGLY